VQFPLKLEPRDDGIPLLAKFPFFCAGNTFVNGSCSLLLVDRPVKIGLFFFRKTLPLQVLVAFIYMCFQ
jgi:hypothetical protein